MQRQAQLGRLPETGTIIQHKRVPRAASRKASHIHNRHVRQWCAGRQAVEGTRKCESGRKITAIGGRRWIQAELNQRAQRVATAARATERNHRRQQARQTGRAKALTARHGVRQRQRQRRRAAEQSAANPPRRVVRGGDSGRRRAAARAGMGMAGGGVEPAGDAAAE